MLSSLAVGKLWTTGDPKSFLQDTLGSILQVSTKGSTVPFQNSLESHCVHKIHKLSSSRDCPSTQRSHHLWGTFIHEIPRSLLCHMRISASSNEDYQSSRNIAISLIKRYRNVIDRGGGDNLKEFINAGVNAYVLGCTDEGLMH